MSANSLILGIKVGPRDWREKLIFNSLKIPACEVYFDLNRINNYKHLFKYLRENKIVAGLHLSSLLKRKLDPNFATNDSSILQESIRVLEVTIDIAVGNGFRYVIYHPGSSRVWGIDKKRMIFLTNIITPDKEAEKIFLETSLKLHNYAKKKKIHLYIETLPRKLLNFEFAELTSRYNTLDVNFISLPVILLAGKSGCQICNDICHTIAGINSTNPHFLQVELLRRTKLLLPYTGLVHLATVKPPFNGADDNGAFLREDYAKGAIPDRNNIEKLLKIFMQKNEIILIPEPKLDPNIHIKNYKTLSQIITNLSL